jgi:hypothetical protein
MAANMNNVKVNRPEGASLRQPRASPWVGEWRRNMESRRGGARESAPWHWITSRELEWNGGMRELWPVIGPSRWAGFYVNRFRCPRVGPWAGIGSPLRGWVLMLNMLNLFQGGSLGWCSSAPWRLVENESCRSRWRRL